MELRARLVVVIDEPGERRTMVCVALRAAGLAAIPIACDDDTATLVESIEPGVIVASSGLDAAEVVSAIRRESDCSIVLLTSDATAPASRMAARRLGVDSILRVPDELDRLVERVAELSRGTSASRVFRLGDLMIDERSVTVRRDDAALDVTPTEYRLLLELTKNAGTVISKTQLLQRVWGFEAYDPNVVEVHVSTLRRKLEAHGPRLIHTVRGFGYVLRPASSASRAS
jgi:DNA-binding response OmpR family regulator